METIQKEQKPSETLKRILPYILFLVVLAGLLLYGLKSYGDFGVSYDDGYQRYHTLVTYNSLFLKNQTYQTDTLNTETIPSIQQYGVSYGTLIQLPTILWEHIHDFTISFLEAIQTRHFYVFLWFFASVIFFFRMGLLLFESPWMALLGTVIYILCPRILADANYNVKDSLCMALFTISLYYGIKTLRKQSLLNIVLFLVFAALCTTSRIVGGEIIAVFLFVLFLKCIREKKAKRFFAFAVPICVVFIGVFIVMTPQAWSDPISVVLNIIKKFMNYTTWKGTVLYFGKAVDGQELPWHYLFVWIFLTVPVVYQLFYGVGIVREVKQFVVALRSGKKNSISLEKIFLFLTLVIPFVYVLIANPTLYNGWRHFYFIYPLLAIWAVYGIEGLLRMRKRYVSVCTLGLLGISVIYTGMWILQNHPYEYVYFQPITRAYAQNHFDLDYWTMTDLEMFQYIDESDARSTIYVKTYSGHADYYSNENTGYVEENAPELANYVITWEDEFEYSFLYQKVKSIQADGAVLQNLWKRDYTLSQSYEVLQTAEEMLYEIKGVAWEMEQTETAAIYTGTWDEEMAVEVLALSGTDREMLKEISVSFTEDGTQWKEWSEDDSFRLTEQYQAVYPKNGAIKKIRICVPTKYLDSEYSFCLYLGGDKETAKEQEGNHAIESIATNVENSGTLRYAVDGNDETRWETPVQQTGFYVEAALNGEYDLNQLVLDYGASSWDYPRNLHIYISLDGEDWSEVEYATEDNRSYTFTKSRCRYVKMELGDTEGTESHWSVYEIKMYAVN